MRFRRLLTRFSISLLLALAPFAAEAQEPASGPGVSLPVREVTLDNGLRVLILPRAGAPTAAFVVQYAVGSVNEHLGNTGIAHLLEHLLFKGTTTVGTRDVEAERALFRRMDAAFDTVLRLRGAPAPDTLALARLEVLIDALEDSARAHVETSEFDRLLTGEGARGLNASTSAEATNYFVQLPANRAELWFALEADRMTNPVFREFYSERDVVMEERRTRVEDSPSGRLYEAQLATAFFAHPYGVPVIGWMSDLERLTRAQVSDYYRRYYAPANAVVAIVGAVDPDEIEALARRYLGPVPPGEPAPPVLVEEPPQRGERRIEVEFDASPLLRIAWRVPAVAHEDAPALSMLAALLTGGRTSRLYRALVLDSRVAASVSAVQGPGELHPRLFQIEAYPRAPHTPAEVEAAIYAELDRLREAPPEEDEVQRVRNQLEAGDVRRLESNLGLASQLAGSASLLGDWRETFRLAQRFREVTPADVQRVVRRYFDPSSRTVAVLVRPEASP